MAVLTENMLSLFQNHTVELYRLKEKEYELQTIPARDLITVRRFDFFAKMAYVKYRKSQPDLALKLYGEHIKAFNPDLKEPGREDKNGLQDFVDDFDKLIDYFSENDFNPEVSIIPVDAYHQILDGSHRLTALAYFNKKVTIAKFKDTKLVADFDYQYFQKRGLATTTCDLIALEGLSFADNLHVACLWPKMGNLQQRSTALDYLRKNFDIFYVKNITMSLEGLSKFIYETYKEQDWVGTLETNYLGARDKAFNCYSSNGIIQFVIFRAKSLDEVLKVKDEIRGHYKLDKHALHITDNHKETEDIMNLILTEKAKDFTSSSSRVSDKIREFKILFKNLYWINFKVAVAKTLGKLGLRKG